MNSSYLNSAAGAFLGVVFVLMSISFASDGIFHSETPENPGFIIVAAESTGGGTEVAAEAETLTPVTPLLASADVAGGQASFKKCAACHSVDPSGANKVGPGLWNIINRPAGAHEGFKYSAGLTAFSNGGAVLWDYEQLNAFLAAPKKYVAGTSMGFAGLKSEEERANVISYLNTLADTPIALPTQ